MDPYLISVRWDNIIILLGKGHDAIATYQQEMGNRLFINISALKKTVESLSYSLIC